MGGCDWQVALLQHNKEEKHKSIMKSQRAEQSCL